MSKAGANPSGAPFTCFHLGYSPALLVIIRSGWKGIAKYKRSSLLGLDVSYEEKSFKIFATGGPSRRLRQNQVILDNGLGGLEHAEGHGGVQRRRKIEADVRRRRRRVLLRRLSILRPSGVDITALSFSPSLTSR
jgi:hypothetical protein